MVRFDRADATVTAPGHARIRTPPHIDGAAISVKAQHGGCAWLDFPDSLHYDEGVRRRSSLHRAILSLLLKRCPPCKSKHCPAVGQTA